jgi:hypothetical protein
MTEDRMSAIEFFSESENHFRYLMDVHGLVEVAREDTGHWDVCEVTLQSPEWGARIGRERGSAFMYVGPTCAPDTWFDIGIVITFLEREGAATTDLWFGPKIGWSVPYDTRLRRQLAWYAERLRPYPAQVAAIFRARTWHQTHPALLAWKKHKDEQALDALARGEYPALSD